MMCKPKNYKEWTDIKIKAKELGHEVFFSNEEEYDGQDVYKEYPYLVANRHKDGMRYIQGNSETNEELISVRKFKEILGIIEIIRPQLICQTHELT